MTHLRLVDAEPSVCARTSALGPAVGVPAPDLRRPRIHPGRPWDELEPVWLPTALQVRQLREAACVAGISVDLAVSLVLERALAVSDVARIDAELVVHLDRVASVAGPVRCLGGTAAGYLRQLTGGAPSQRAPLDRPVLIPGRVAMRLAGVSGHQLAELLHGEVPLAVSWERAAILAGRTIGEWAAWETTRLLRSEG